MARWSGNRGAAGWRGGAGTGGLLDGEVEREQGGYWMGREAPTMGRRIGNLGSWGRCASWAAWVMLVRHSAARAWLLAQP
eukprot:354773-Chlamydomonas_euryale.AAC.9